MQLATRLRGGVAVGVLALVAGLSSPTPALAAEPAVSDEPIQLVKGHIDAFNLILNEDESVRLTLKEDETGSHVVRTPESVELYVKPAALTTVPAGYVPGLAGDVYFLPLTQNHDLIWPGWDSLSLAGVYGTAVAADIDINITDVDGPGDVFLWSQGSFGAVTPLLNGGLWKFPGTIHQSYLAHVHANWAFTAPGTYKLTAHAVVTDPGDVTRTSTTQTATYTFVVAERTALTPQAPTQDGNTVTIPDQKWMNYADGEGAALEPGALTLTEDLTVTATPAYGFGLAPGATDSWTLSYVEPPELSAPTPTVTGAAVVGATLEVSAGSWGPEPVELAYQWLAEGAVIPGATGDRYTVTPAELGRQLSVAVTGSKDGYPSVTRESEKTSKVTEGAAAVATVKPSVSGTAVVGATLSAQPGEWSLSGLSFAFQWFADGDAIPGATGDRYTVTPAELGKQLSVAVIGSKDGYHPSQSESSERTAAVVAVP
ncbi:MAG: choice-of-anchor M domain-containing protein, partial [Propionibacteriaceae bacterium]|nr:choice-of-anchor M domain-containing protein [Propionibacteriaceae bacterium]